MASELSLCEASSTCREVCWHANSLSGRVVRRYSNGLVQRGSGGATNRHVVVRLSGPEKCLPDHECVAASQTGPKCMHSFPIRGPGLL